ncbi:MAG: radical SAM protein [SAR202 cluster bacterium]|jgi:radical SAM superfamily enzyme YgiQ (UPF0313 family)|nr:radical SAM protein [SAR202 cluster bacterium]|tara:strand:- start:246 stop:2243 length:1998 start_codon:yes stop_codon:yes gene_type:complete
MKILLCSAPVGTLEGTLRSLLPRGNSGRFTPVWPLGLLRLMTWMEENGYSGDIYDIYNLRPSDEELIKNFKRYKPTVIGLSATLSHCYPNVKRIAKILRKLFPDIWIVAGGHLTSSAKVVLNKTEVDICVTGDGEIPFVKLLDYFKLHPTRRQFDCTRLNQIKGLAFTDENNKFKLTGSAEQLTEYKYPNLDKLRMGLQEFNGHGEWIHELFQPIDDVSELDDFGFDNFMRRGQTYPEIFKFYKKNINKKIARIFTSRGCVARCTFCQRARKGYSIYAPTDFETHIIDIKKKYNVGGVHIMDENFGSDKKQSYEIARIMKKHDIFWSAGGVRCKSVTYEDLKHYKENNMLSIRFGIESGSQRILDVMEKKFTTKDVYNAILNCKKVGVSTSPDQLMIAMPGETTETVIKSAQFVASIRYLLEMDWNVANPALAMAIPGTPLYEYCQQIGVIGKTLDEEENYLMNTSEFENIYYVNYVNKTEASNEEVHSWIYMYQHAAKKEHLDLIIKNNKSIKDRLLQVYEQCIKATFKVLTHDFNLAKEEYKDKKLLQKMKKYTLLMIKFLMSLSVLLLPKAVLFPFVRMCANVKFYYLNKAHKKIKGKQKSILFTDNRVDSTKVFRLSESRVAETTRPIDRSLRTVVMDNRRRSNPPITDEEKGLQILAQGR